DITDWDICKSIPQEAFERTGFKKEDVYQLLAMPGFYDNVKPLDGYPEGIQLLRRLGADVYYVSSCVPGTCDMKIEWLQRHDPGFDWRKCFFGHDKFLLMLDVLIDDAGHNLEDAPGSVSTIRMIAPYNMGIKADAHIS